MIETSYLWEKYRQYRVWIYLLLILLVIWLTWGHLWTLYQDIKFEYQFRYTNRWKPYIEHLELSPLVPDPKLSLCFVCMDTRQGKPDAEYIDVHNANFEQYVEHQNAKPHQRTYTYQFSKHCWAERCKHIHNAYWCKFFLVRELLESNKYDFVVWVDSDTGILNYEVDLADTLRRYQGHCFVALDKPGRYDILNAGVIGFRNSELGRKIIRSLTEMYNSDGFQDRCVNGDDQLRGVFGHSCYEQGVMNQMLYDVYRDAVTVLPSTYIHHGKMCDGDFIIHVYGASNTMRTNCFRQFLKAPTA